MHNLTAPDLTLLAFAREMKQKSYAPYSDFRVGAAIFANGDIFQGCNIENAAYGSTMCAEASALAAAVAAGCHDIEAVAVVGDSESPTVPCGNCRQMLAEFNPEMRVIMGGSTDEVMVMTLEELLPEAFVRGFLDQDTNEPE
jgi:cytidine deaminase